jgi:hypothetical protein
LLVVMFVAAVISLWSHRNATSPTGPHTTQSAPSSSGQGGTANTGAAR